MAPEHFDVIIIGAGLSGIGAACHLQRLCPGKRSGYMRRAMRLFPKQGDQEPWVNTQDYRRDKKLLRDAGFDDGVLVFSRARAQPSVAAA